MDLFAEKRFIEKFEKENNPERYTYIQEIISTIFSRYANIRLFTDASFSFIEESELLTKFSDINTGIEYDLDFDGFFRDKYIPAPQTIILTEVPRQWFTSMKKQGALCYSYDSYENEIREFIRESHINRILTGSDNYPFDWSIFQYLRKYENYIIITDPYLLRVSDGKIKANLITLLKTNLDKEREYKIFIIADVTGIDKEKITQKIELIYQYLDDYQVIVYLINNFRGIDNMRIHDRYFFTNHVIVKCGIGFNLNQNRELSEISGKSIFDFATYRNFRGHFSFLRDYLREIEKLNPKKEYKTNNNESFKSFFEIADRISS